ncbi:hypothetical protein A0J57_09055 [Sphingobium sp. 22B]|uniref:LysR substrate-binding domain-containing protein n=1 Tax=Sphingobium sp. AM TaxID=1176302 RepID=UPI0007848ECC|nr:LysR substrate-binding domain-containing protein [Sphingobium sp. AM]KXU32717.1 hypothetical protein AXW74_06545 [Sphingobium sp. AM]KYC32798.1 hypothetical protein A0J57_09055 [Sphingobium sp. 22B]OAP31684.1 hypothetical protein A8O16_12510 [Sphingobium sp. 20006FA]
MLRNLPIDLVRSFTVIVDSGSMQKASERVPVTASALSLQMKRLEDLLQLSLFHRDARGLTLTAEGSEFLRHARAVLEANDQAVVAIGGEALLGPVRLGFVQDFADAFLGGVLSRIAGEHGDVDLEVRSGKSMELLAQLASNELDVVFCMGQEGDAGSLGVAPMLWLGNPALLAQDVIPLALLNAPCRFREAALTALQAAERPYHILMQTEDLSVLKLAVARGMALTTRTALFAGNDLPIIAGALPQLPNVSYIMRRRRTVHGGVERLANTIGQIITDSGVGGRAA